LCKALVSHFPFYGSSLRAWPLSIAGTGNGARQVIFRHFYSNEPGDSLRRFDFSLFFRNFFGLHPLCTDPAKNPPFQKDKNLYILHKFDLLTHKFLMIFNKPVLDFLPRAL